MGAKFLEVKYRVRRSVNPTNHVKHGIRQVLFPYKIYNNSKLLNLSFCMLFNKRGVKNVS